MKKKLFITMIDIMIVSIVGSLLFILTISEQYLILLIMLFVVGYASIRYFVSRTSYINEEC